MVAALTENFDQITRNERRSPVSKGTIALRCGCLVAGLGAGRAGRRVWPAEAKSAPRKSTQVIAHSADVTVDFRCARRQAIVALRTITLPAVPGAAGKASRRFIESMHMKTIGKMVQVPRILTTGVCATDHRCTVSLERAARIKHTQVLMMPWDIEFSALSAGAPRFRFGKGFRRLCGS